MVPKSENRSSVRLTGSAMWTGKITAIILSVTFVIARLALTPARLAAATRVVVLPTAKSVLTLHFILNRPLATCVRLITEILFCFRM